MSTKLDISLVDVTDIDALGSLWCDVQDRSAHSFFTSWGWIGCWLRQLPAEMRPQALIIEAPTGVVGLALLNRKRLCRGHVIVSDGLFLNETGVPDFDSLTIEHNGLLVDRNYQEDVFAESLDYLQKQPNWDELFLSGIDVDSGLARSITGIQVGAQCQVRKTHPYYLVNLDGLRETGKGYLESLSANTRQKIRKSMRLYEEQGKLQLDLAHDLETAWRFYDDMKQMHTTYWQSKGKPGAFAHSFCDAFYRCLIETRFPHGEIQLASIRAGEMPLGYLFNFKYAGCIYSYQSGFAFDDDPKLKPGMVSHCLAIQHAMECGDKVYDFLAGDCQYKQSLSSESHPMEWVVVRRNRARFRVEEMLRKVKRFCRI